MPNITEVTEDSPKDSFVDEPSDEDLSGEEEDDGHVFEGPPQDAVAKLLQQLKSSGAAVVKRVQPASQPFVIKPANVPPPTIAASPERFHCKTCNIDFPDRWELNNHLIRHVKLPNLILQKLASDDEDDDDENQEDWSDVEDDQETEIPFKETLKQGGRQATILKTLGMGISIKKAADTPLIAKSLNFGDIKNLGVKKPQEQHTINKPAAQDRALPPGPPLRLTIKHSTGKQDFQVVSAQDKVIKKEPVIPAAAMPTSTIQAATAEPMKELRQICEQWDKEDTKDGILDRCIKTETNLDGYSSITTVNNPLMSLSNMQSKIKDEVRSRPGSPASPGEAIKVKSFAQEQLAKKALEPPIPKPMLVPKKEPEQAVAIIEINGDDSDNDDIMFVDSTPATVVDKKPVILPPISTVQITELPPSTSTVITSHSAQHKSQYSSPIVTTPSPHVSTEKQHNFDWNAPSKSYDSLLTDKSPDAIFESLLASHRKDGNSDDTSEYISLDTLGPKHTCEVCQSRFTDSRLLENHKRVTGHSNQLVLAGASSGNSVVNAYSPSNRFLMNSLSPFKQIAETVGKLANVGGGSGVSHQQNIMVNISAFPGQTFMPGQQAANAYPPMHQQMAPGYPSGYRMNDPSQGVYSQYPPQQPYNASGYGQYSQLPNQPMYGQQPPAGQYPSPQQPPVYQSGMYGQPPQPQYGQSNQFGQHPSTVSGQAPPANVPLGHDPSGIQSPNKVPGIRIQNPQSPGQKIQQVPVARLATSLQQPRGPAKLARGGSGSRGRGGLRPGIRGGIRPGMQVQGQAIRGGKPAIMRGGMKRPLPPNGTPSTPTKKRLDMLLPDKHDNEDCQVMSLQQQRDGFPLIESIKGSKESMHLGSGLTVTKTRVRPPTPPPLSKDAGTVASMLAQRGIKITAKAKSPSPPPVNIPNLGSGISITKKSSAPSFMLPEDTHDVSCSLCSKMFSNSTALNVHMSQMHPNSKPVKCDSCPVSYPTSFQLNEHKKLFHNSVSEMGLPVVDLSQQANLRKLNNLGIFNFIPLANREQGNGCYGIPIVSVQNALNGTLNTSLQALGAGGLLSLGPVKPLPKC